MSIPLVLLPGLLCDEALWRFQIKSLENIANSSVPNISRQDNVQAIARDVLSKAPRQFAMAGLSMGGYVALEIMRQAPERVLKLCLLDTSARADTEEQRERRKLLLMMSRNGQFKGVTPRLLPMLILPAHLENKELTSTIMTMAERMGREAFHNQQTAILNRPDSRAGLKNIRCPVHIFGGRQDTLTPPDIMREIADGIGGARFDIIDNCGHLSTLEQPDEATRLMRRWLEA